MTFRKLNLSSDAKLNVTAHGEGCMLEWEDEQIIHWVLQRDGLWPI